MLVTRSDGMKCGVADWPQRFTSRALLEACVTAMKYVPERAERMADRNQLPPALARMAEMLDLTGIAWLAWTDDVRVWFVAARKINSPLHTLPFALLRVFFIDDEGRVAATGEWEFSPLRGWSLHSV